MDRLITAHPRSATHYLSYLMSFHGLKMGHEGYGDCEDGTVSYRHADRYKKYDIVLHCVRDPLKVISSCQGARASTLMQMAQIIGKEPYWTTRMKYSNTWDMIRWVMWTWVNFNDYIDTWGVWRFRIEDIDEVYPELCERLNVKPLNEIPPIPRNYKSHNQSLLTYGDLKNSNIALYRQVREKGREYGYN